MTYQTEIRGLRFFHGDDGRARFQKLALAEIYVPELSANIVDVALTWSEDKGWRAVAPFVKKAAPPTIRWNYHGAFAVDLAEKLKAAYLAMGGKNPEEPKRVFIPASEIDLDGTPAKWARNERIGLALDRMSERDGRYYFTEVFEFPEADDDEAEEGLHRTLGVDAVAETMEQAGL